MPRPFCCRRVQGDPPSNYFKPRGVPLTGLQVVTMTVDEFEAIRLADLDGLYQEDAAKQMRVSRQTFGRIIESAHRKIAEAVVRGKALEIKGGEIEMSDQREFECSDCGHKWPVPFGTAWPAECPKCKGRNLRRSPRDSGRGRWGRGGPVGDRGKGMRRRRRQRMGSTLVNLQGGEK